MNKVKVSENNQTEKKDNFKQYQWIVGTWVDTNTFRNMISKHFIEKWSMHTDSVSGLGIKVVNGDTTINEYMSIRLINGKLKYVAKPIGQPMIPYNYDTSTSEKFQFINRLHDFPQIITYEKISKDSMTITLKGVSGEFERGTRLHFKKVGS